jgi:hypothetical protein
MYISQLLTSDFSHLEQQKCFVITEEIMRRTFLIQDLYVKCVAPQLDVIFEDIGLGVVSTIDTDTVLAMIKDTALIL